jgi:hypothetical protein
MCIDLLFREVSPASGQMIAKISSQNTLTQSAILLPRYIIYPPIFPFLLKSSPFDKYNSYAQAQLQFQIIIIRVATKINCHQCWSEEKTVIQTGLKFA